MYKCRVDTLCINQQCAQFTENPQKKKINGAGNHKHTRSLAHRPTLTQAHKPSHASGKSLMLMRSERQRRCISRSTELLWVRLWSCVSSSRQTLLSGLCVGVSKGTVGLFCYETWRSGRQLQQLWAWEHFLPGNTSEHFSGSQCFIVKMFLNHTSINRLFLDLNVSSHDTFTVSILLFSTFSLDLWILF